MTVASEAGGRDGPQLGEDRPSAHPLERVWAMCRWLDAQYNRQLGAGDERQTQT